MGQIRVATNLSRVTYLSPILFLHNEVGEKVGIMIGIYKIENKINGKVYIGQSVNIKRRWKNHKTASTCEKDHTYNYPLYKAFRKYGIDNFTFDVIEECELFELDRLEKFWINYYNSYVKGYNQTLGGYGIFNKSNKKILDNITQDLIDTKLSIGEIAKKYKLSYEMIQGINTGRYWIRDIKYPIRNYKRSKTLNYCIHCGKEISNKAVRCADCYKDMEKKKSNKPPKETLLSLICKYTMVEVGQLYKVSNNTIKKWCKSYDLPFKYNDIKQYKLENNL